MIQPTDTVELCDFDLVNDARWKAMSEDAVKSVCGRGVGSTWSSLPALCPSSLDAGLVSNDLEQQLRALVLQHRMVSYRGGVCEGAFGSVCLSVRVTQKLLLRLT